MIAVAIRAREICTAALQAARRVQPRAQSISLSELPNFLRGARGTHCLVIHDFEPDPAASAELLRAEREAGRSFSVLALLRIPATTALDVLFTLPREFPLCGVALSGEESGGVLSERIRTAFARGGRRALLDIILTEWRLDPTLARVAESELRSERPHTTLEGLLREAGVGRRVFVRVARSRGLVMPLRFLQGLRVMEAAELLQQGCTTRGTAERLGYGSLDTLRVHFRVLAGTTPAASRRRSLGELAAAVGEAMNG